MKIKILPQRKEKITTAKIKTKDKKTLHNLSKMHMKKETKQKITKGGTIILILILMVAGFQLILIKWQMSRYRTPSFSDINDYRQYMCVQMSYDDEKYFEQLGFHVVERRVENQHRWIAIEIGPDIYIDFECTLNLLGTHIVTDQMVNQPIEQSEGFFQNGKEIVHVSSTLQEYDALKDWKVIGTEGPSSNIGIFRLIP